MKLSLAGVFVCSAIIGVMAVTPAALAKTVKECRAEWSANKAANQAKHITEKAYVEECRAGGSAAKATEAKEKKSTAKEKASAKKENAAAKEKASSKMAAPAAGKKKTVKECESEWRANKAANQAKGITEKAYVAECRAGTAAMKPMAPATAPTQTKMAPPADGARQARGSHRIRTGYGQARPAPISMPRRARRRRIARPALWFGPISIRRSTTSPATPITATPSKAPICARRTRMAQGLRAAKNEKHP